jgi:hypothetical protein
MSYGGSMPGFVKLQQAGMRATITVTAEESAPSSTY